MKIDFTQREYRLLIDMLYLSIWMMGPESGERHDNTEYRDLRKKILSYYEEAGIGDVVEYVNNRDEYFEFGEYEELMDDKFIRDYDGRIFWEELLYRLSTRDMINKFGVEKYQSMGIREKVTEQEAIRGKYAEEFEQHSTNRIKIDENAVVNDALTRRKGNLH